MVIETTTLLLNSYYLLVTAALIIRDILWLRVVLVTGGFFIISYGFISDNRIVIVWNSLFALINTVQIVRLIIERRPVHIDDSIKHIYEEVFSTMRKKDFLRLWHLGHIYRGEKKVLCQKGYPQRNLFLIVSGEAEVIKNGKTIAILGWGKFVAEMSFVTGKPATADVVSKGSIRYIMWSHTAIQKLQRKQPELYNKLQHIITRDLTEKLASAT